MLAASEAPSDQALTDSDYRDQADFRNAIRLFVRFADQQARAAKVTPQQHALLQMVRGHPSYPNVSIGDIAARMQIHPHSASLLVDRGAKRGLVVRQDDPQDRRRVLVSLTPLGQEILDHITIANRHELRRLGGTIFRESLRRALRG